MIRYVIRPSGILTTPRALKERFGALRTVSEPGSGLTLSFAHDFFLAYPPIERISFNAEIPNARRQLLGNNQHQRSTLRMQNLSEGSRNGYTRVREFYTANKHGQRRRLRDLGFPTPGEPSSELRSPGMGNSAGGSINPSTAFVIRPLRHTSGAGYTTITGSELRARGWNPQEEYVSELFPKTHEYRILIVRGEPLITLIKKVPDGTPASAPWNHACGSYFVTVTTPERNRLRHTNVYGLIEQNRSFFENVDLGGLDVLYNKHDRSYVVCELNFCPSLSIETNLEKVVNHVLPVLQ